MLTSTDHRLHKAIVLYDGDCPFCQKTVALLKRLDWTKALEFQNCREMEAIPPNEANLDQQRMIEEMHLLLPNRKEAYAGFRAFRWIAGRIPLLWALYPLLYIPGVPQLGQKVYLWVAKNRYNLVPCHNGVCSIPSKRK
jgi:predicted DCC family thiol-disulfide oxidoreductase YuxK